MLIAHPKAKIYLYNKATDMRKSFNTLAIIVNEQMKAEPANGAMYVFCSKRQDKVKILQWENNGFWLHYFRIIESLCCVVARRISKFRIQS